MSTPWATGRIGDVCRVIPGYAFKSSDWQSDGIPVVKIKNITTVNSVDLTSTDCVSDKLLTSKLKKFVIQNGDILLAMTGATAGKVGRVRTSRTLLLNQRVAKIEPVSADPDFIWAIVSSRAYQEKFFYLADGAAQPNMSGGQIEAVEIPLPPMPIQRRIAGILSAYDDLIENCQRRIQILEEMSRSLYREWFVNFRYPGHESVPLVPSVLGEIPDGWEVQPVHFFGNVITGKTPSKANTLFYGDDVPFIKTPDMHGNVFVLSTGESLSQAGANSQSNKTLPVGSICVSCIGTIGVVSITTQKCQTNQQINSVVLHTSERREFLYFRLLDAKQLLENLGANGATIGNVNKSKFEAMGIITPTTALIGDFHKMVEPMFQAIHTLSQQVANLRKTRDLLLPRLMSGQLEVTVD